MGIKLNISDKKSKKSKQIELSDEQSKPFVGRKVGSKIKGEMIDMTGYEFEITGGSDKSGFPMRKDLPGTQRKKILAVEGKGVKPFKRALRKKKKRKFSGIKQRKSMRGNTISSETAQLNVIVVNEGKQPLFEEPKAEEAPVEGAEAKPEAQEKAAEPEKEAKEEKPAAEEKKE